MKLKYDLFDMVSASIMNSEPIVIVEGKDDYQIYQTISNAVNPKIQVYQVNEFEDYHEGCTGVIKCMQVLQPKFAERAGNIHKVLGIIDRDARHFRGEIPELLGLFCYQILFNRNVFCNGGQLTPAYQQNNVFDLSRP